jgi:vitamin B12/bleomycin/antimicrobial peptide transport system ATP-binding/permease protein
MYEPLPSVPPPGRPLLRRFWASARGFWSGDKRRTAWLLSIGLLVLILVQIFFQYRMNVWNRDIFNALEKKDGPAVLTQAMIFVPLVITLVTLGIVAVYGRMTLQRTWREWLSDQLLGKWLAHGRYYQLDLVTGDHQNPEGRIGDDARVATDAPVDFVVGIVSAAITAITFISVLWVVGGDLNFGTPEVPVVIPGFLVIAAVIYAVITSTAVIVVARRFVAVEERTQQAEAEFRYALTRVRENGESIALLGGEDEERAGLRQALAKVVTRWRSLLGQHMRYTLVSNTHSLVVPVVAVVLCAPKYVTGEMTLGAVMQAAAAFVQVQSAFNWLLDNYPRLANWVASAHRVGSLLVSIDYLDAAGMPGASHAITRMEKEGPTFQIQNLSVELDDGTVVIKDADVVIKPGERVLLVGESGTGKTTLTRAIAGLWPWGQGNIAIPNGARMVLMPQRPYIPLGTLRRAATYPLAASDTPDATLRELMTTVGLGYLIAHLDEDSPWSRMLSGGECQRLAFVRLLLHQPDIVVMDEATSALDPPSQEHLMMLLAKRLPHTAVVSITHRPELEAFHHRKLTFERRPGGSRLVGDTVLMPPPHGFLPRIVAWLRRFPSPAAG